CAARVQSLLDDPEAADALAYLDVADVGFAVGPYYAYQVGSLQLGDGPLRDKERPLLGLHGGPHSGVLARPEDVPGIGERATHLHRPGLDVHLPVRHQQPASFGAAGT